MAETPCPHVNTAMIAAGFTQCAVCEHQPAAAAKDDLAQQRAALGYAFTDLALHLEGLATEATKTAKVCRRKGRKPSTGDLLEPVHQLWRSVLSAEQCVDLAALDLSTAGGADA
jgi:hypothetical protein